VIAAAARRAYWHGLAPALRSLPVTRATDLAWRASQHAPADQLAGAVATRALGPDAGSVARDAGRLRLRTRLEVPLYPRLGPGHVELAGQAALDDALAQGGAIAVVAHFGVHGLTALGLALHGYAVTARTYMLPAGQLDAARAWSQAQRRALEAELPLRYVRVGEPGDDPEGVLASGGVLYTNGDGWTPGLLGDPEAIAPLLGAPFRWPQRAWELSAATGAPCFGLFLDSRARRHRLELVPLGADPFPAFVDHYARRLREQPGQWQFWRDAERAWVSPPQASSVCS
jgi:hypothetical protein